MSMAPTLHQYMQAHDCDFEIVMHRHARCSAESARSAHVPAAQLAKPVMLEDERGYLMAVLPADRHIDLDLLARHTGRQLQLAKEFAFAPLFRDCELGAVPPAGPAYGIETVLDDSLRDLVEVYFEAGDHEELVRMRTEQYLAMMDGAAFASFSRATH